MIILMSLFVQLTIFQPIFLGQKLHNSVKRLVEANEVKKMLDTEENMRQFLQEEAESKSRKETELVLQKVQNLEQDLKLTQDKMDSKMDNVEQRVANLNTKMDNVEQTVANLNTKMDNVLVLLQQLRDASKQTALASSQTADEESH